MAELYPIADHPPRTDLSGRIFNSWKVISYAGARPKGRNVGWHHYWNCKCVCGTKKPVLSTSLVAGLSRCCGCLASPKEKPAAKRCRECKREFPFTDEFFTIDHRHPFGLRARCKSCVKIENRGFQRNLYRANRLQVLRHYSKSLLPFCACCGESHLQFLALDHIHGGGLKHRTEKNKNPNIFARLKSEGFPEGFRVLCHNCNISLGKYGFCPHKPEEPQEWAEPIIFRGPKRRAFDPSLDCSTMFKCRGCDKDFPLNENFFCRTKLTISGFLGKCRDCMRADVSAGCKRRNRELREIILHRYGGKHPCCACCKIDTKEFLALDHASGGGNKHRKECKGNLYSILKQRGFPDGYRLLCHNCNCALGFYGHCPHNPIVNDS